jgi:hypothetical protein
VKPYGMKPHARAPSQPDLAADASRAHQHRIDASLAAEQLEGAEPLLDCEPWCAACNDACDSLGPFVHEVTPLEQRVRRDDLPRVGPVVRDRFEALIRHGLWLRAATFDEPDSDVTDEGALLIDWTLRHARLRIRLEASEENSGWSFATSMEHGNVCATGSLASFGHAVVLLRAHARERK